MRWPSGHTVCRRESHDQIPIMVLIEQRFPKPKVGGSTPLGTAMISNEEFQFVARANLTLFAESASRATSVDAAVLDRPYLRFALVMVNGPAWKALIEKEFGDGIMSAIDFTMAMERVANPNG